ncbi:MAG: DNA primase [Candidatus Kaiserbacteria bacterium]|nr:MAG: DNA primase [Candidatus Kaiserbacteria bacterium]
MSDTVQQIKDKLSIVDVVSQYVKLERSGAAMRARCPFHNERTPSFFVSAERGTYHCFGCDKGGDILSFVEEIEGLDFKGALKVLAEKAGVPLVYERQEKKDDRDRLFELLEAATIFYTGKLDEKATKYLKERGLKQETMKEFRLGQAGAEWSELSDYLKGKKFSDAEIIEAGVAKRGDRGGLIDKFRNRIIFPIADSAGRVVGFSGRIFGADAHPDAPKYLNSPETPLFHKSRILYGFDRSKVAMRKLNCAVLVEGQMDLLASHQAGWANTVAVSGTAFTPEHAKLIRRITDNLVIALDADAAGIKAAGRAARAALQGGLHVKVAQLPAGTDPADLIQKEGADAWKKAIRESKDIITFLLDVLESGAKSKDVFRRNVEIAVLPFLADVQSPIAREQYTREIAERLHVSEAAVAEALGKTPATPQEKSEEKTIRAGESKVKQAYALLLWQRSLPKPEIDTGAYEKDLAEAAGKVAATVLERMDERERERLRFSAEGLYGRGQNVLDEASSLLRVILQERLSRELAEAAVALKKAEGEGDQGEIDILMQSTQLLTKKIADLHKKG